jgi:hypothetical protein
MGINYSYHRLEIHPIFLYFIEQLFNVPFKKTQMDYLKSLELEILITIGQNNKVPIEKFDQLFDDKWYVYSSKFDDLKLGGLFKTSVKNPELTIYQLTSKGNIRMMELLDMRTWEIEIRLISLQQNKQEIIVPGKKMLLGILNFLKGTPIHSKGIPNPEPESH